jgi:hypothetical protein
MSTTTTYPNGQALVSSALKLTEMNDLIQQLTLGMLGLTSILALVPHAGFAGSGYKLNDQVTVVQAGGTNGLAQVTGVDVNGAVTSLSPAVPNQSAGFEVASGLSTTGGSGSGLQVDVTAVGPSASANFVRLEWPQQGAPFGNATDDVCYLGCFPQDDPYDKIRDEITTAGPGDVVTEEWNYTRAWRVHWTFYGPNAFDRAAALRSALFIEYFTDQLSLSNVFPVSAYSAPVRLPELINGQWFDRVDFECEMYENVSASIQDQTVISVEVIGKDDAGTIFDVTVT